MLNGAVNNCYLCICDEEDTPAGGVMFLTTSTAISRGGTPAEVGSTKASSSHAVDTSTRDAGTLETGAAQISRGKNGRGIKRILMQEHQKKGLEDSAASTTAGDNELGPIKSRPSLGERIKEFAEKMDVRPAGAMEVRARFANK